MSLYRLIFFCVCAYFFCVENGIKTMTGISPDKIQKNKKRFSFRFAKKQNEKTQKTDKTDFSKIIACTSLIAFMAFMLVKPDYYLSAARKGLSLFASSVLPSLFPFYFCSLMLTYMGAVKGISKLGAKPVKLLYNTPKESAYALFLSILCGYPVGASTCEELYKAGALSQKDVKSVCSFCSTSGPIFMIGTIGGAIFSDTRVGWIVLASHYLGALLNGLIFRKRKSDSEDVAFALQTDTDAILAKAISKATVNMLYVGGYIVICGMLVDTLELIGLKDLLSFMPNPDAAASVIYGAIEMTRGCLECASCSSLHLACVLCTGAVSFGGLSVTLQNYTFLSRCGVKLADIGLRKIIQCALSMAIAFLLGFAL